MNAPHLSLLLVLFPLFVLGCDEDACEEPDDRGAAVEGEACVTTGDCTAGLACIGTDVESDALCASPTQLPGGADPGCIEHPDDWTEHESHGVEPASPDDEGCDILIFVSGCNCVDSTSGSGCLPVQPFYRQEIWRSCNGCCWRLVSFWNDESACDD